MWGNTGVEAFMVRLSEEDLVRLSRQRKWSIQCRLAPINTARAWTQLTSRCASARGGYEPMENARGWVRRGANPSPERGFRTDERGKPEVWRPTGAGWHKRATLGGENGKCVDTGSAVGGVRLGPTGGGNGPLGSTGTFGVCN